MSIYTPKEAVELAIKGTAPEREKEFVELWEKYSPQIELSEDKEGFTLEAVASYGIINYDHKSMAQIWLLGFALQEALKVYSPFIILSLTSNLPLHTGIFKEDESTSNHLTKVQEVLNKILELKALSSFKHFDWPKDIPEPKKRPSDDEGKMAFDLLCMSSAYIFLHEIRHIMFKESNEDIAPHEEEMKCDQFARNFIFEKINEYSESSGYDLNLLKTKRAMSIAISSVLLLLHTPKEYWSGSDSHPPIRNRIDAFIYSINLPENDNFWLYFSTAILSILELNQIVFECETVNSYKTFCVLLLDKLES